MKGKLSILVFFVFFVICCFSNKVLATNWSVSTANQFSNAINNSVNGDTITVTSDITTTNSNTAGNKSITIKSDGNSRVLNGNGSGCLFFSSGTFSIDDISFTKMKGAISNNDNSSLTIGGGVYFSSNTKNSNVGVTGSGGGVCNYNDSLVIIGDGVLFSANETKQRGGGVYNAYRSTMTIGDEVFFSSNTSVYGGAVYNNDSVMTIGDKATFVSNEGTYGAAVYNIDSADLTIGNDAFFSSNTAKDNAGAINNIRSSVAIGTGATFSSNTAKNGGALLNGTNGILTIGDGASFLSNFGREISGAIQNINNASLTIGQNALFSLNTAGKDGGGVISNRNGSSVIIGNDAKFSSNTTASNGGAIYNTAGSTVTVESNSIFDSNSASIDGGAIYNEGEMEIGNDIKFISNTAGNGGAFINIGEDATMTIGNNLFVSSNSSDNHGGAIYNGDNGIVDIGNVASFEYNTARENGGAIYNVDNGLVEIGDGSSFSHNTAENGGAIYNGDNGFVEIGDGSGFVYNTAEYGGAIYNAVGSTVTVEANSIFGSNSAGTDGGAIYNADNSIVIIGEGVLFSSNTANTGGAIYNGSNGLVDIGDGARFAYNTAENGGGAIYNIETSTITIGNDTVFLSNTAENGGALYNIGASTITIGNSAEFLYNTAEHGGAIYNVQGSTTAIGANAVFSANKAGSHGGAIYLGDGVINMENPIFVDNEAGKLGGAVYIEGESEKAEMNIKITEDIEAGGNTANGVDNVFYLAQKADLNLDIDSGTMLCLRDGVVSEDNDTAITKTGEGLLLLDSANNRIDGILNIFGGEVKTGYSTGKGNIFFDNSALLHITDDIEMKNNIYAKSGGVQDITIETDDGIKLTMSGVMGIGNETLNKNGTGSMIFDTASSTNLLKTNLTEGTLRVFTDDYVSENVEVSNGATLSGTGKITGNVINKGIVRPGGETSIGTLSIDGNYTEKGILGIRLYQNEIPTNDLLLVSGNADIDNVSKIDLDLRYGFKIGEEYTILTATSGVNGIYNGFVNNFPSFNISIYSDANNVYLKLDSVKTNYSDLPNLSHNQKEVSKAIDKITNGTDNESKQKITKILGTTEPLDEAGKKAVFDEIAGCIYANMLYASADNSGRKQLYNQISKKINRNFDREEQTTCTYNLWGQLYGSQIIRDTDSNSINKFTDNSAYAMIGWDNYCGEHNMILGYVAEFGKHKGKQGDDEFKMNDYKGGVYFGTFGERWNFKSSLTGGYQQYEVDREQKLLQTSTESEYSGYSVNAAADLYYVAYQTKEGKFSLSPFGGLEGNFVYTKAFTEKAKGNAASWLDVKENNFLIADAKLGFRVENIAKLGWYAELSGKYNLTGEKGTFKAKINGVDDEIEIFGLKNGKISGKLEVGLDLKLGKHFDIFLVGIGEQAENFGKYSGHIGINYGW